ncbi:DUF7283 family protein [Natronorubrum tibetense]|uniref:Uncharacterized protein n=1 Tax=Natronorubrum tibetense GA33 TaxID=1114856 RepID=L9VT74_9EURY|nr:hypothetical protein [Natronorubrum tibetense]ELY40246.1 hypothetical protein C496_11747 [Natronorubrum tibetense GA33]
MDWEAPADAWYVWVAVAIVSFAMAGIVLGLPTAPPPDADGTANAIEETSGSSYEAASTYGYDADEIKIDGTTIELRNEEGTDRSSLRYEQVVVVNGDDRLERLVYGETFEEEFEDEIDEPHEDAATVFMDRLAAAEEDNAGEWLTASEELTVRQVAVEPNEVRDIHVEATDHQTVDIITDEYTVPRKIDASFSGFGDESTDVHYTVTGTSIVEEEYDGSSSFWSEVADTFSDWVDSARCWLSDCEDETDPEDELNPLYETEREWTHRGTSTQYVHLDYEYRGEDEDVWVGDYPLTVTAEFDGTTCSATLDSSSDDAHLCPLGTDSEERADELNWIELNDETEKYHVTLVVV